MSRYALPLRDSLVIGHANPDGDSLSSIKAVIGYLRENGKAAFTKMAGNIPEHLSWIVHEDDFAEKGFQPEQTIVLDCAPTEDRVGFHIEGPIISIDHHASRKLEHNPSKKMYVLDRCSMAAALVLDFGIVNEVLLVGLYTDTLFMNSFNEVLKVSKILKLSDERAKEILSAIRPTRYLQALVGIKNAKLHKCRNGFFIVETEEKDPIVVSEIMDTLFRYSESVCLIDGNGQAKLRTSNKGLIDNEKLLEIADIFGGGGHPHACVACANGRRTTLVSVLKQLEIEENTMEEKESK
jgi:nanoRNase/pAp phosphatase (c-di-AMP/oligoRNAs hydrolase)